ncbi:LacI family transcriptional regulator [Arthrobacter crusticola]|uniref:LacI family transcriptional regulator n=1 Tax=Arthrobacter crusticola TaxID=2547960 RepID=A0A4R5TM81_9MICC|nr:LacI family transcriptional regulator [Arthrobacter crusticola]
MVKGPTVYDVAELAGVSIATVSFTFRQPHRVRQSTREAVLAAAQALNYLPSGNARGLARGRTGALGIYSFDFYFLDDPASAGGAGTRAAAPAGSDPNADYRVFPLYVDEVQRGVALECWRRGYTLMVGGGNRTTGRTAIADIAGQVDGLAVFPRTVPVEVLSLISRRIPVVELSEPSHDDSLHHVTVDNAAGMHALTTHLITAHGLRDLQFAAPRDPWSDFQLRFRGFQAALAEAGLPVPERPVTEGDGAPQSAEALAAALLAGGRLPDGIVCAHDEYALPLIDALLRRGVDVPGRVAVTGFDGIVAGRLQRPQLTTVRQPMEQMGRTAAAILIDGFEDRTLPPQSRQLPVEVVLRESCGCPPA